MSVYFVYRSHYEGPSGKHVRVLDGDSVLGWFQSAWERAKAADDIGEWLKAELGCDVYGLASIFETARDESLPPPKTDRKLKSYLEEHLYVEGEILFDPHAIQVFTDDDEIELAYFLFDDHYLRDNPGRAAYLLHEGRELPTTSGNNSYQPSISSKEIRPTGHGSGATYLAFLAFSDSLNLTDLDVAGPCRIDGVRLPRLGDYLVGSSPNETWPLELKLLRSQLLPPDDGLALSATFKRVARFPILRITGWMMHSGIGLGTQDQARGEFGAILEKLADEGYTNDPSNSIISVGDHVAQLCLSIDSEGEMYHQWIIFDDLWAGQHPDLAEGILRYANRWDVLTT